MQRKKTETEEKQSRLSSESPHSIIHIASISLCVVFPQTNGEEAGHEHGEPATQRREVERREAGGGGWGGGGGRWRTRSILYNKFMIQIYTDSGVMYKRNRTDSKAIC